MKTRRQAWPGRRRWQVWSSWLLLRCYTGEWLPWHAARWVTIIPLGKNASSETAHPPHLHPEQGWLKNCCDMRNTSPRLPDRSPFWRHSRTMYRDHRFHAGEGQTESPSTLSLTKSKRAPANMLVRSAMVLSSGRAAQGSGSSSFPGVGASVRAPIPRR